MFRFHKTLDVITLFHKASSPASVRAHTLLKQASANASSAATEDQASDHSAQTPHPKSREFQLDVTEEPPTEDQLKNIIEYAGLGKIGSFVKGAKNEAEALKKLKESGDNFTRPVTVDWENGRAVAGDNESEILKLVQALKEDK